jgi:putative resolvase
MSEHLNPSQAAERLKVSQTTVRRWIRSGHLRAVRLPGGRYRIDDQVIEAILAGEPPAIAVVQPMERAEAVA